MNPTGRFWTLFDVVMMDMTMMKNNSAVVLMVFCMKRMRQSSGYLIQSLMSVSIQTSFVINPRNHRRRCLSKDVKVCTASVLQNALVHIWIWYRSFAAIMNQIRQPTVFAQMKFAIVEEVIALLGLGRKVIFGHLSEA